jgi:hypothetical protein
MKTKRKFWRKLTLIVVLITAGTLGFLWSCEKEIIKPIDTQVKSMQSLDNVDIWPRPRLCGSLVVKSLYLGNNTKVGTAYFYNDNDYFYAHVVAQKGILFHNLYLFTGLFEEIPLSEVKNPDFTSFNYSVIANELSSVRKLKIPLSELEGSFSISLMVQTKKDEITMDRSMLRYEKAWADGKFYGNTAFGRFFQYSKGICRTDQPDQMDE